MTYTTNNNNEYIVGMIIIQLVTLLIVNVCNSSNFPILKKIMFL